MRWIYSCTCGCSNKLHSNFRFVGEGWGRRRTTRPRQVVSDYAQCQSNYIMDSPASLKSNSWSPQTNTHTHTHTNEHTHMRLQAMPETINFKGLDINRGTKVARKVCVTHITRNLKKAL